MNDKVVKTRLFVAESHSDPWWLRVDGVHDTVRHSRRVGTLHITRGPGLLPAPGDAHEV